MKDILRSIPKVDKILAERSFTSLTDNYNNDLIVRMVQTELEFYRTRILKGRLRSVPEDIIHIISDSIKNRLKPFTRHCVNATGIVLNTGLGRAPLSSNAIENLEGILNGYSTLEVNVDTGKRGRREDKISELISLITGAEAATVVNNNAAAVMICLNTLASRKEIIISRGEQVEIGGSFRMPDVIRKSGCRMIEIGSTNKVKLSDYEEAVTGRTGALVKVHTSNYRVKGFTAEVEVKELTELGRKYSIPVYYDLGGGIFSDLAEYGLGHEPTVQDAIKDGADLFSFSGDKVLGGPQCGIIAGRKDLVDKVKKNPLMRVLRTDKVRLALLEETLKHFVMKDPADSGHITLKLLSEKRDTLRKKAVKLAKKLGSIVPEDWKIRVENVFDQAGSGTLPTEKIEGIAVSVEQKMIKPLKLSKLMRTVNNIPVFGYVNDEKYYISIRTVFEEDIDHILNSFKDILKK